MDEKALPKRNVSFEEGLKGDAHERAWAFSRPKTPLKIFSSDLESESSWLLNSSPKTRSSESSQAMMTPRSQGSASPLPLAFLFRHLSGMKTTIGEAMVVAKMSASTTPSSAESSFTSREYRHSYSRVKGRKPRTSALRAMSYPAIVASLLLQQVRQQGTGKMTPVEEEPKFSRALGKRSGSSGSGSKLREPRQRHVIHKRGRQGDLSFLRDGRHCRRRKKSGGARNNVIDNKKHKQLRSSGSAGVTRKWDVQTALGPLLQIVDQTRLIDLRAPVPAESLSFCSDGTWQWRSCLIVGYDSSWGMYRALCEEDAGRIDEGWGLSGNASQQGSTRFTDSDSNLGSVSSDSRNCWGLNPISGSWQLMEVDHQQLPTRLIARLNIRFPQAPEAHPNNTNEQDGECQSPIGIPPASAGARDVDEPPTEPSFRDLKLTCRLDAEAEALPSYCSTTQGSARYGQDFNAPFSCSIEGSVRQGHVVSEASACALRNVLKPLNGVESRLGVGVSGETSEKSFSCRRLSVSGKSGAFGQPGEFQGGAASVISEGLLSWRKKERPESARCIIYDVFPLLSELAREFEIAASAMDCTDITSLAKAGVKHMLRGPRPVRVEGHSFTTHSTSLAASAALLRPGLQAAMLLVVDSVKLVEKTRFLAISLPCVSIAKAMALQIDSIEESTDYIRKRVLADARDALNTALVRDEGLTTMKNGSKFYIRIARWANIVTEAALAKALKGTLDSYATRFDGGNSALSSQREGCVRPIFIVKLSASTDTKLTYRTPLSKLNVFSGKLLDDVLGALLSLPFMDTKDSVQSKVDRDVLRRAADEALPVCRLRVSTAVAQGTQAVEALQAQLSDLWTDYVFFKHKVDSRARDMIPLYQEHLSLAKRCYFSVEDELPVEDTTQESKCVVPNAEKPCNFSLCLEDFVSLVRITLRKKRELLSAFTAAHGKVVGNLFRFDCDELLVQIASLGHHCKNRAASTLIEILRGTMTQLSEQLAMDEAILSTSLSSISAEKFAQVESVVKSYEMDPNPLHSYLEILKACHSALGSLCLDISDDDVHAYWSLYARSQNILVTVISKEKFLADAKSLVIAGIRTDQATYFIKATEFIASIDDLESLKDVKDAFDNEFLVKKKLQILQQMKSDIYQLRKKEELLNTTENQDSALMIANSLLRMEHLEFLWSTVADWIRSKENWMLQSFQKLNVEHVFLMVQTFGEKLTKLVADTISSSSQMVILSVADEVNEMLTRLPLLLRLRHPGVRRIHWVEIASKTHCRAFLDAGEVLTLKAVLNLPLPFSHQEIIWTVLERAAEEYNQEVCLEKMEEEMRGVTLELSPWNENGDRQMLHGSEAILELLDDQLVAAGCMLRSPFAKALEGSIRAWRDKIHSLLHLLEGLLSFQKWFEILRPIFRSVNIRQQLMDESGKFSEIERLWQLVLDTVVKRKYFMHVCESSLIFEDVPQHIRTMEGIMCSLITLLERKRATFPRFYFLSNDELLQVLSHEQNPDELQYYLCKCFCNLYSIEFSRGQVTGVWVEKSEFLPFLEPVYTFNRPVEEWTIAIEQEMRNTVMHAILGRIRELHVYSNSDDGEDSLHELTESSYSKTGSRRLKPATQPMILHPAHKAQKASREETTSMLGPGNIHICQVLVVGAHVSFCSQVENILATEEDPVKGLLLQSANLSEEVEDCLSEIKSSKLRSRQGTYKSLVLLFIYFREIISRLVCANHIALESFEWQRSLRYYCQPNGDFQVGIMNKDHTYGCDLIDSQNRLVMTSLTEKCFLGLLYAFSLGLGCTVTGSGGVGKTQTIKDCAKALGKHCIVMNCSKEFDHQTIGNALKGMASGGLWLCFTKFERLKPEVVSILTQQLLNIQQAIAMKAHRFNYEGFGLQLNPSFAICTTTKPKTSGYYEHIHHTRSSFRSVSMVMPDCNTIVEVLLTAEGIPDPAIVAQKLTACFKMAAEQLSFEDNHCDFGLRAMKAVIKWMSVINSSPKDHFPTLTADNRGDLMLCKTLQQYCLPRLVGDGYIIFSSLLSDFFPHFTVPTLRQGTLEASINSSLLKRGLSLHEPLLQKCLQLHGAIKVHRGVLIVGDSGSGKTQCYSTLSDAINSRGNTNTSNCLSNEQKVSTKPTCPPVTLAIVNPSSVCTSHLFGCANSKTQSWQEGIVPNILRESDERVKDGGATWMVFDGNMDSIWLEHVSTMLDDTGVLCLNNGKRILLPHFEKFNMLFEVENLKSVSPGAVSRCGILLMDPEDHGWKPLVDSWLQCLPAIHLRSSLQKLCEAFLAPCLDVAREGSKLPMVRVGLVNNLLNFLSAALKFSGICHDSSPRARERVAILDIAGMQSDRFKAKYDSKSSKPQAKSSIEKLGMVKQLLTQRQKQVRDAVNWRRLHHRKFTSASEDIQDRAISCKNECESQIGDFFIEHDNGEFAGEDVETLEIPISEGSLRSLFVFGLLWSVGGNLHGRYTQLFEKVVRDVNASYNGQLAPFPEGSMFDFYYDITAQTWKSWNQLLVQVEAQRASNDVRPWSWENLGNGSQVSLSLKQGTFYIPTVETVRIEFLAHALSKFRNPVLLCGELGTGKTVVASQILQEHTASSKCQVVGVTLNSTSTGSAIYNALRPKLAIWKRRSLIPAVHGKMLVFVDDLNTSQLNVKQEGPALQFLRFLVEQKGWYGLPLDCSFTSVEGLVHLAAMSKLGSGISSPIARLLRHYYIIHSPEYKPSSLGSIFSAALRRHYQNLSHSSDCFDFVNLITEASIDAFSRLRMKTPSWADQPSFVNLHDLFRVQRQILLGSPQNGTSLQVFHRLWAYEFSRVCCDRLRNTADRKVVISELYATTLEVLNLTDAEHKHFLDSLIDEEQQPLFGTFHQDRNQGVLRSWSRYEEVPCRSAWEQTLSTFLASYSEKEGSQNSIVLFPGALSHLSRLLNILRISEEHAVLLGYSGSGRSSLARLATYVMGYTLSEVNVNGSYDYEMWTTDLRNLLKICSLRDTPTVLLIILEADACVQNRIMEDLNLIVHCGEALQLLGEEEKYYIQQELHRMEETTQASCIESVLGRDREQFLNTRFVNRLKENLHLVICAENSSNRDSSSSSSFASALISRHFAVDYYDKWTPVALQAVAEVTLAKHELVKNLSSSNLKLLTRACSMVHTTSNTLAASSPLKGSWRLVGMPSYHEMLHVFGRISKRKGQEVDSLLCRLETGLKKLRSTRVLVENMQQDLQELLRRKEHTNLDMDQLLLSISEEQVQMDKGLEEVAHDEKVATQEAETCKKLAQEAQDQVQEVAPEVLTAIKQLSQLNKKDISELKSFTQPPPRLLTVLEALCVILKKEPKQVKHASTLTSGNKIENSNTYWPIARELLSQVDFVKMLLSFDKDAMENSTMEKLKPYMDNPLFKPEKVRRISVACRSICVWIRAMYNYHYAKTVKMEPRIEKLKIANHNLETCKDTLEEARRRLGVAEENLRNLRARYQGASYTKDGLAKKAEESELKLQRAVRLIGRLDGECRRWSTRVDDLKTKEKNVVGDAVLASGMIAYLGSFPALFRAKFVSEWQANLQEIGLPYSTDFSLVTFYTTPQDIKAWATAGLPPDDHSLENAIIVCNTSRPLLILDPQKQVSKWICSIEDPLSIVMVDINSARIFEDSLSCALSGHLLLAENVGNQTPPGLLKQVTSFKKGYTSTRETSPTSQLTSKGTVSKRFLHCGCILLTYEQGFNYSDEVDVCVSLNVVDFSITFHGLCSQLLSIAAEKERADLEEERNYLLHQRLVLNCRLQEIEDHILTLLQGVMVTILDDEVLEEALSKATSTYADIQAKLAKAAATEGAVELTRKRHLPVAERAAILYSCIADVSTLESVYQWTLPWFKNVYSTSMQRTSALNPVDFDTRLEYLISKITVAIYRKICCGLLKKHQFLFGLLVVFRLAQTRHDLEKEEWLFLLQGESGKPVGCLDQSCPLWLEPASKEWRQLCALSTFPRFKGLLEDLKRRCWKEFFHSNQSYTLPAPWPERLGPFRSLLVLRCLRLDMVMEAIHQLVKTQLKLRKEDLTKLSLEDAYEESNPETPVTCIFQSLATPLDEIMTCAKRKNMLKRLWVFSLDQCQGSKLLDAVKEAATWGKWVVLQNCHANTPWINNYLQTVLEEVKLKPIHESFRLWLTMVPTRGRPPYLLSDSVKIVVELPRGIKCKILQILLTQQADEVYFGQRTMRLDDRALKHSRVLFQLALFHAVVQARAAFGAMGWNISMHLDHTDFNLAKAELISLNDTPVPAPSSLIATTSKKDLGRAKDKERARARNKLDCLQYMMTKIIYGGYVVDYWDEHSLTQLFKHCFDPNEAGDYGSSMQAYLPKEKGTLDDFVKHANDLPEKDDPEVMGLPKNALLNCAERDVQELFTEALTLETGKESFLAPLTCLFETKKSLILQCLSELEDSVSITLNEHELRARTQQIADPFSMLLLQEVKRYNQLILVMRTSIEMAVKGLETPGDMTPDMETFCSSIIAGQVPELWLSNAYASIKSLASWISEFHKRIDYMKMWVKGGLPNLIWISGLFFPQAVFAATLQRYARAKRVPLSSVHLDIEMIDKDPEQIDKKPEEGCYIFGLHLEGARWDGINKALAEAEAKHLLSKMCVLWLRPRTADVHNAREASENKYYCCPIYTTQARNGLRQCRGCNYVGTIDLPVKKIPAMHWVLQRVALICSSRD